LQEEEESERRKSDILRYSPGLVMATLLIGVILFVAFFYKHKDGNDDPSHLIIEKHAFDHNGRFILEDYDQRKPVANFLAGVAGYWGIPMWLFYVNRGQAVCSFGIQNKDNAMKKFDTAEKAYQTTPFKGFRTLLKARRGGQSWNHEPFFPIEDEKLLAMHKRSMMVGMNEVEIQEEHGTKGLQTNVLYFTAPNEDFPAMIRRTTLTNHDAHEELKLDVLDGLAMVLPAGLPNVEIDQMGRLREAYMRVYNVDNGDSSHPFYHISQGMEDTAKVSK
jgi:hypothetical protein